MYGFSKWTEQAFQNSIKLLRWCPNKDLLAVLHDSSDVEVFRLPSWTVVCTLSDPRATASISAISWKPDGKSLATGYSDGTVKVFDVETGTQQCVLQGGSAELACLEWMKWGTVAPEHQRNISLFAGFDESHLGALPKLDSLSADEHALHAGRTLVGESESDLDVLLMPDVDGNVNLSIAGRLPAGSVSLQDPYQAVAPPRFLQTWLAPDLSSFSTVLARTTTTENRTIEEISLIDFATQLSGIHRAPLQALAAHLAHVDILLDYVGTALNALDKEWRGVQELAQTERAAFKVIMDEHAVQSDLGGELLHLLLVGTPGMILEPYLVQRLNNNNGLKTWHKAFEAGMQNVRRLACLHILPAMERLILHLDGLKGLGKWSQGHGSIEVNLEEVQTIAKTIRMLAMYVENLQSEALCTSKSFVELVKWLGAVCHGIESDVPAETEMADVSQVKAFICQHLQSEKYRTAEPFPRDMTFSFDPSEETKSENYTKEALERIRGCNKRLTRAAAQPSLTMKDSLCIYQYPVSSTESGHATRSSARQIDDFEYIAIHFESAAESGNIFCVIRRSAGRHRSAHQESEYREIAYARLMSQSGDAVVRDVTGLEMFDDDRLVVLHGHQVSTYLHRNVMAFRHLPPGMESVGVFNILMNSVDFELPCLDAETTTELDDEFGTLAVNEGKETLAVLGADRRSIAVYITNEDEDDRSEDEE